MIEVMAQTDGLEESQESNESVDIYAEKLEGISEEIAEIALQLERRREQGVMVMFGPDSVDRLRELGRTLQSASLDELPSLEADFRAEIMQFGQHFKEGGDQDPQSALAIYEHFDALEKILAELPQDNKAVNSFMNACVAVKNSIKQWLPPPKKN